MGETAFMIADKLGFTKIKDLLLIHRAMALGAKRWHRSKVMIVGEGRVGKTALCISMLGKAFMETESTVGFTRSMCDIRKSSAIDSSWTEIVKHDREYEAGLARMIKELALLESNEKQVSLEASKSTMNVLSSYDAEELLSPKDFHSPSKLEPSGSGVQRARGSSAEVTNLKCVQTIDICLDTPFKLSAQSNDAVSRNASIDEKLSPCEDVALGTIHDPRIDEKDIARSTIDSDGAAAIELTTIKIKSGACRIEPDADLVMKYLDNVKVNDSNLILSLFDFGGQSVFNVIHHLFLTSYGVYVFVFNMVDMLDIKKRDRSLNELSFWINSVYMHSLCATALKMAPVFIVGTHGDKISNRTKQKYISNIIEERFESHVGWPSIQGNNDLCFFPVNNRIRKEKNILRSLHPRSFFDSHKRDQSTLELLTKIESTLKDAAYIKEPRPLTWLRALDELVATKKCSLTITEASNIAIANGVEEVAVPLFLSFLNEMGEVLWLDESGLRDVVILDIITFFVEPATLIICNHISTPSDRTIHHKNIQEVCSKHRAKEWYEMTHKGLVSQTMMEFLLAHKVEPNNIPVVINMLLKYGLIVRLEQTQDGTSQAGQVLAQSPSGYYLVPALLPATIGILSTLQVDPWRTIQHFNSCYFIFAIDTKMRTSSWYHTTTLQNNGFLPRGLMERLICKAVTWCQLVNITHVCDVRVLCRNYAALSHGRQQFRLVCIPEINCIRLDVEGEHPLPIYEQIYEQVDRCVKECMGSLQFVTALRWGPASESEAGFLLLNLKAVKEVRLEESSIMVEGYPPINCRDLSSRFGAWLGNTASSSSDAADETIDHFKAPLPGRTLGVERKPVHEFFGRLSSLSENMWVNSQKYKRITENDKT